MKRRRLFYPLLPVITLFVLCQPAARAQQVVAEGEAVPFHISSLDTGFAMQGDFEGEYTVHRGSVKVRLKKALVRIATHCPYKGYREFQAIRFALATANPETGKWDMAFKSQKYHVGKVMLPGDEHRFDGVEFVIPKEAATDLAKHWFVVQMDDLVFEHPTKKEPSQGYAFADSCQDIFVKKTGRLEF